ncbi:MAG: methylmalonyl Co-A mutase-associated GTPase MeaB, partial [Propionibacterium sp.]|nr:methylmalonyl Co-A mutase-associated GTPase MeaB [Propionibacterium sp.]
HSMRTLSRRLEAQVRVGQLNAMDASAELLQAFAEQVPQMDWAQPEQ